LDVLLADGFETGVSPDEAAASRRAVRGRVGEIDDLRGTWSSRA
jgi:hypothetical protein